MIKNNKIYNKSKMRDLIVIICDFCKKEIYRKKKNALNLHHYCNNTCQGQHKKEIKKNKILERGSKICRICSKIKNLKDFNKSKNNADGYNNNCRECSKINSKKYYKKNKKYHIKQVSIRNKKIYQENRKKIFNYLKNNSCIDCGNSNPIVLEFDHKDNIKKKFIISSAMGNSWDKIKEEINKCDVRCANCHRIRTAKQFNWYKYI